MHLNNGLSQKSRQDISDGLATYLANTYSLYLTTQSCHWNVTGPEFFSLHILFEKQYEELAEAVDEIAERIRALGFYVDATFSGFKKMTTLTQENKVLSSREMLLHLIECHENLIRQARKVAQIGDDDLDFATVDMIGRRIGMHEKMAWFLRSHL